MNAKQWYQRRYMGMLPFLRVYTVRQTLVFLQELFRSLQRLYIFLTMSKSDSVEEHQYSAVDPAPPPPFDPTEPSVPISYPIKSLEELESRSYFKSFHYPFNVSSVNLEAGSSSLSLPNRPRILVCHDMAGGYTDDKLVQGGSNENAYAIWHWYLIDIFVYFSHNLVTLPPPCWTNTAHRHGVKVLGTFITEWDEGRVVCNALLSTKESAQMYAERLTELAVALGFDGWLINMEVALDLGQIPNLKEFVSHLTRTMHSSLPGSLVIWYDSVTINGDLSWQNQLNKNNKPFFDICDGLFVNYSWKEDYPKVSAALAGDRKFDVYMGIDVFGRGTYGGGQWNTNVALDVIKKDDVSAAIFAPGWVYETKQPPDFQTAQNHWWALVEKSWGTIQSYPKILPFYSNFDQGRGYHFSVEGRQVSNTPWCNLSCQAFQPFLEFSGDSTPNTIQAFVDFKEASYGGGANITFKGTLEDNAYFTTRLFKGELLLGDLPINFTYSVKSEGSSLVGLSLEFSSTMNERSSVLLASWGNSSLLTMNQFASKFSKVIMPRQVTHPKTATGWIIQENSIAMNGYSLTEIHAVCYRSIPERSNLKLQSRSDGLDNIPVRSSAEYFSTLGHISITTYGHKVVFPPSTSWLVESPYINWGSGSQGSKSLSTKITWKLKAGDDYMFPKYNIYVEKPAKQGAGYPTSMLEGLHEYLGVAQVKTYYVSDLFIPLGTSNIKFIIQVCAENGTCQNLDESPSFLLKVK